MEKTYEYKDEDGDRILPHDEQRRLARVLDPDTYLERDVWGASLRERIEEVKELRLEIARLRAAVAEVGPIEPSEGHYGDPVVMECAGDPGCGRTEHAVCFMCSVCEAHRYPNASPRSHWMREAAPKGGAPEPCEKCDGEGTMRALDEDGERCRVACDACGGTGKAAPKPPAAPLPEPPSHDGEPTDEQRAFYLDVLTWAVRRAELGLSAAERRCLWRALGWVRHEPRPAAAAPLGAGPGLDVVPWVANWLRNGPAFAALQCADYDQPPGEDAPEIVHMYPEDVEALLVRLADMLDAGEWAPKPPAAPSAPQGGPGPHQSVLMTAGADTPWPLYNVLRYMTELAGKFLAAQANDSPWEKYTYAARCAHAYLRGEEPTGQCIVTPVDLLVVPHYRGPAASPPHGELPQRKVSNADVDEAVCRLEANGVRGPDRQWVRECLERGWWPDYMRKLAPLAPWSPYHDAMPRLLTGPKAPQSPHKEPPPVDRGHDRCLRDADHPVGECVFDLVESEIEAEHSPPAYVPKAGDRVVVTALAADYYDQPHDAAHRWVGKVGTLESHSAARPYYVRMDENHAVYASMVRPTSDESGEVKP